MFDAAVIRAVYGCDPANLTLRQFNSLLHRALDVAPIKNITNIDESGRITRIGERRMNNNV